MYCYHFAATDLGDLNHFLHDLDNSRCQKFHKSRIKTIAPRKREKQHQRKDSSTIQKARGESNTTQKDTVVEGHGSGWEGSTIPNEGDMLLAWKRLLNQHRGLGCAIREEHCGRRPKNRFMQPPRGWTIEWRSLLCDGHSRDPRVGPS